jgi:NitT/TauT family transport system ATP-binding protein
MAAHIALEKVSVRYPLPNGRWLDVLESLTTEIAAGEFISIVGPSGSGKSTLIRVIAGLEMPTGGCAMLDGKAIQAPSPRAAMMFQDANLMPWRTVVENIALPLEISGVAPAERIRRARLLLPRLGLTEFGDAYPQELSGGMAQRAALGRVLIQQPDVLLLDEPFGALDALTRERISLEMQSLWQDSPPTTIMVTHSIQEAVLLADRVLVLSQRPGRLIADIPVPLPKPRTIADVYLPSFADVAQQVRTAIERS